MSTIFSFPGSHAIVDGKRIEVKSLRAVARATAPKVEAPAEPKVEAPVKAEAKAK